MSGWQSALKPRWPVVLAGLSLAAFAIPLLRRSIVLADEGYILLQSLDMLNGKVLYRDMDAFVTPGIWIVIAATFKLFGPSVIASRVPVFFALLLMYATSYRITARLAGPRYAAATLVLMAACTVWAFPGWTFAFYSPFSILFALVALDRLLVFRQRARQADLLWCGLSIGVSIVFKQNYGALALVGVAIGLVAVLKERRSLPIGQTEQPFAVSLFAALLPIAAGVMAIAVPLVVYLALAGALPAAWQSLVVHPFEFSGKHDIPFLPLDALFAPSPLQSGAEMLTYAAQPIYRVPPPSGFVREIGIVERLHVLFYWAPPVLLALGAVLAVRPDAGSSEDGRRGRPVDAGLASVVAVAGMVFLGVFPRADFNHLTNVYQPIVVAGVVIAHQALSRRPSPMPLWMRAGLGVSGAVLALVLAVSAFWYHGLLKYLATPVPGLRAGVLDRPEQAQLLQYQIDFIRSATAEGEAVLTLPDLSMLNFLADRPMPSPYYNLYEHHIAHDQGAAVVAGAEEKGVELAITRYNNFFSDRVGLRDYAPKLTNYLATHFEMQHYVGNEDFIVFRRREEPIVPPATGELLPYCDAATGAYNEVRTHLLFTALYHNPGTGRGEPAAAVETHCKIDVPLEGAALRFRAGYRAPALVVRRTTLVAEVIALAPAGSREPNRRLMRKTFVVVGEGPDVLSRPLFEEWNIDLSRYAGESLELVLRTERRGTVLLLPLEHRGFGTSWEDLVLIPSDRAPQREEKLEEEARAANAAAAVAAERR